jgi:decaprenylphospho-beta-D-erythro-pentofuranosid-2-ulose 2-reductase
MRDALGRFESLLVLGGTSDIGVATARLAIERGARRVVLAGRDPAALEVAARCLRTPAAQVTTARFDADDVDSHTAVLAHAFASGDVDVVLVAFGTLGDQVLAEQEPVEAVRVATTNYVGAVSALTVVANLLRRQGHGAIAVLSSVAGQRVRRSNYVYGSAKAGLDGFCQGLGDALHPLGIDVLVVRPGFVRTKMTAGLRAAPFATDPDTVAARTLDALAAHKEVVWVPGVLRGVMAVLAHLPRTVFRRLPV